MGGTRPDADPRSRVVRRWLPVLSAHVQDALDRDGGRTWAGVRGAGESGSEHLAAVRAQTVTS
jgi:hypothetical protein